jgi:hypothetical protein
MNVVPPWTPVASHGANEDPTPARSRGARTMRRRAAEKPGRRWVKTFHLSLGSGRVDTQAGVGCHEGKPTPAPSRLPTARTPVARGSKPVGRVGTRSTTRRMNKGFTKFSCHHLSSNCSSPGWGDLVVDLGGCRWGRVRKLHPRPEVVLASRASIGGVERAPRCGRGTLGQGCPARRRGPIFRQFLDCRLRCLHRRGWSGRAGAAALGWVGTR